MGSKPIRLGRYKGIEAAVPDVSASEKEIEDEIVRILIERSEIGVPAEEIEKVAVQMAEEFAKRLMQQGLSLEQYYIHSGLNQEQLLQQMMPTAEKRVKGRLVLEAVAEAERLEATEEEYRQEINRLSVRGLAEEEEVRELVAGLEENQIRADIAIQKAMKFLKESAVIQKK